LAALNHDNAFRNALGIPKPRCLAWVAESEAPDLVSKGNELAAVDRLVEVLKNSELYVCILGDHRHEAKQHGSPVPINEKDTAVSYFEIELYAAAMYQKKVAPFVLEGFDPGPRLQTLLKILDWAIPDWHDQGQQTASEVFRSVRELIGRHHRTAPIPQSPLRKRLVAGFCKARFGPFTPAHGWASLLFLGGQVEQRAPPEAERVEELIKLYRQVPDFQKKLSRLWFAARELMPVSYLPGVQPTSVREKFLPYWDCVLGDWAGAAAWHGWHGHLYAGTVAPLNSQSIVRSQGFRQHGELQPEVILPPDGALASAYYSISGLLGASRYGWKCLWRAGAHVRRAINSRDGRSDNLLAIRGSIRLRMGYWPGAISDFRKMLHIREGAGAPPQKIADALMHLGHAYSFCPLSAKGRDLLRQSVAILESYPDDPNLARARRKLASAYKLAGQRDREEQTKAQANADARRLGAYDQMDR